MNTPEEREAKAEGPAAREGIEVPEDQPKESAGDGAEPGAGATEPAPRGSRRWGWVAGISAVALLAAVGVASWGFGYWQGQSAERAQQAVEIVGPGNALQNPEDVARRVEGDPYALGPVDAPVVISEFSDFECPFCAKFANETEQQLIDKYVHSGKVRIEWNDMPINGPAAHLAAEAGRAAGAQGRFWEFNRELYAASKNVEGHPNNSLDDLVAIAQKAGVKDIDRFRAEVEGHRYGATVDRAMGFGTLLGISGTPTFLVGDQFVQGAQPVEVFTKIIDAQLDGKQPDGDRPDGAQPEDGQPDGAQPEDGQPDGAQR